MAANRIRSMFPTAPRKGETFELRNGLNSQFSHERCALSTQAGGAHAVAAAPGLTPAAGRKLSVAQS